MKNILVLVHDDAGQEARLQAALDIARAVQGHLICLDVAAVALVAGDPGASGGAAVIALERESETANKAKIESRIAAEDVPWTWLDATDYLDRALKKAAALADLIVVNRALETQSMPDMQALVSDLVCKARKPVLAVPEGGRGFDTGGQALVAWDGSREAADALCAAVPLLQLAHEVTIVQVEDGEKGVPAEEAATYLSRHGARAILLRLPDGHAAEMLLVATNSGQFAYLVMGAFGHSRIREFLFGGVTRRLLAESPIPILLAH
jgi:nucleotide-binding universal stress UspA family protein